MGECNGLRLLQMGVARHEGFGVGFCHLNQYALQLQSPTVELNDCRPCDQGKANRFASCLTSGQVIASLNVLAGAFPNLASVNLISAISNYSFFWKNDFPSVQRLCRNSLFWHLFSWDLLVKTLLFKKCFMDFTGGRRKSILIDILLWCHDKLRRSYTKFLLSLGQNWSKESVRYGTLLIMMS